MRKSECPKCNKILSHYAAQDILNNREDILCKCEWCGFWIKYGEKLTSNNFTISMSTVFGDNCKFTGTKEEIHKKIDEYQWKAFSQQEKSIRLRQTANCIEILKYGSSNEFMFSDYSPYEITVDNGLWMKIEYGIN